jgi:hypothetical protein
MLSILCPATNADLHDRSCRNVIILSHLNNRRILAAEARVRALVGPCGICGGHSGTDTGFSPSSSDFFSHYHYTVATHAYLSPGG